MPSIDKSKKRASINEKARVEGERLQLEPANADPEKLKRVIRPLLDAEQTWARREEMKHKNSHRNRAKL
jgi:hypothetical protein